MPIERDQIKSIRFSQDELDWLEKRANEAGVSFGRYVRQVALGERLQETDKPASEGELWELGKQLRGIGNNINQIARVANTSGKVNPSRLTDSLDRLDEIAKRIVKLLRL